MRFIKLILSSAVIFLILFSYNTTGHSIRLASLLNKSAVRTYPAKDTISVIAVGDMMLGSAYPSKTTLPKFDALRSFAHVTPFLKGDVIFGNLEGCFLNEGKSTKCKDTTGNSCFAFRMPERYARIFKQAGFNLLSIANNHVGDFGAKGRERTAALLDSLDIKYAGLQSCPSVIFEKDSIKYAFCAFSPNENTPSITQLDSASALIQSLKSNADIVIVSFHGGAEGAKFEHVPKTDEIFYKENRGNVHAFAHAVIDAGADVVLGHGPHVTRAVEVYKNKFIAYSLGNFCTYGTFNLAWPNGIAPLLQLTINRKGDFLFADVISIRQTKAKGLNTDPAHSAFKKIRFLTNADFPSHGLQFSGNGRISLKD